METAPPLWRYRLRRVLVASVTVAATAILVEVLAALDSYLFTVWRRLVVCASSHLIVASAASDFRGTDGIGASSKGIGCLDAVVVLVASNLDF